MSGRHVVHVVDSLVVGGAQRLLVTWASEARRRSDPVTVIALSDARSAISDDLRRWGAEVVLVPLHGAGLRGAVRQLLQVRQVLAGRRPAVVQTHLTRSHVIGLAAARLARLPTVATLHSTMTGGDGNSDRALRLETLLLRRLTDAVVACGSVVERAHRDRLLPQGAVAVPNAVQAASPVSAPARSALRRTITEDPESVLLLAVGRLIAAKGYDDLIRAFAMVAAADPRAVLVVVGEGECENEMRALAAQLGVQDRVHLLGHRDDVSALMGAADLYVAASRWEGLPVALLEAMAAGLPVVVTAVGDVPSVVDVDSGRLVPPGEPTALAEAALSLLSDRERRQAMGACARRRVAETSGVAQWYDRLRQVHEQAAAQGGRG